MDPFPLDTRAARTLFAEDINGASPLTGVPKSKSEIFTTEVPSERRAGSPLPYSRSLSDFLNGWAPGVPPSA